MSRIGRAGWAVCLVALVAGAAWGVGFGLFDRGARRAARVPPHADGIVVLTGGAERIETGLRLLELGDAPLLLISGVGRGADVTELLRRVPLSPEQSAHVTFGRLATTTVENAWETAAWVRDHDMHSLIVVTAGYHMPRALLEIARAAPGLALYPVSVRSPVLRGGMELSSVRMMANEFHKYLAVRAGIARKMETDGS